MPSRGTFSDLKSGHMNLMSLNKLKSRVLHVGQGNLGYEYRLGELIESSTVKKDLEVPEIEKLIMSQHCLLAAQTATFILGCNKRKVANWMRQMRLFPISLIS